MDGLIARRQVAVQAPDAASSDWLKDIKDLFIKWPQQVLDFGALLATEGTEAMASTSSTAQAVPLNVEEHFYVVLRRKLVSVMSNAQMAKHMKEQVLSKCCVNYNKALQLDGEAALSCDQYLEKLIYSVGPLLVTPATFFAETCMIDDFLATWLPSYQRVGLFNYDDLDAWQRLVSVWRDRVKLVVEEDVQKKDGKLSVLL